MVVLSDRCRPHAILAAMDHIDVSSVSILLLALFQL